MDKRTQRTIRGKKPDTFRDSKWKDLTGKRFGRLVAIEFKPKRDSKGKRLSYWLCQCDCGNTKEIQTTALIQGVTNSCGCIRREGPHRTHGMKDERIYSIWQNMKTRCHDENVSVYKYYGGRGINYCEEWENFINFKNDMYEGYLKHVEEFGEKNTSIDRINVNGNYEPSNCKWATCKEQGRNQRRNKRYLINNEKLTAIEISEEYGIPSSTIISRIKTNKPVKEIINTEYRRFYRGVKRN